MSETRLTQKEWQEKVINKVKENHIWLNGFSCINPTDKFKISLADSILKKLNSRDCLMSDNGITSDNEAIRQLSGLTPILYISINKS